MTPKVDDTEISLPSQEEFQELLKEKCRAAIRLTLATVLEEEVEAVVGVKRYERNERRRDSRNGYYQRDLVTSMGRLEDLAVPRTRRGHQTQLFERYQRRQAELDEAIGNMFIQGVSTYQVGPIVEGLTDSPLSPSAVSRVFHTLEETFQEWKTRPLAAHYLYLFADGTYFTVIYNGEAVKMPILAVVGINAEGKREVLAFTVGEHENQKAWEDALEALKRRGVQIVDLWITDGGQAMLNAIEAKFSTSQRQRCIHHKMDNVLGYIPEKQKDAIYPELKAIFYQDSRELADQVLAAFCLKYEKTYPTAIECLKRDSEACLTFYNFPKKHWRYIRTTNVIERLFGEVKKRTHKMAAAFRNEDSCLLMFFAIIRSLKLRNISIHA